MSAPSAEATLFEALIVPHRSLSRRGVWMVALGFVLCLVVVALRFWLLGAWMVVLFSAVEVPLVIAFLCVNVRRGRASELVLLTAESIRVVRTDPSGQRRERTLSTAWLRVNLEERAGRTPRLLLRARSGEEEVGSVLGEDEKRELAEALRQALHSAHNPIFDNPQLRD